MLNDSVRNNKFRKAIENKVKVSHKYSKEFCKKKNLNFYIFSLTKDDKVNCTLLYYIYIYLSYNIYIINIVFLRLFC